MTHEDRPKLSVPFSEKRDKNYNYQKYARYSSHIAKTDDLEKELRTYINSQEYNESRGSGYLLVARHFAQWQKEQMLKNAVECHLRWYDKAIYFDYTQEQLIRAIAETSAEIDDKVKIIIVKED